MTDIEQKKIFSKNLNKYLEQSNKTQKEVADTIGVIPSTFNTWCQGIAIPRMGKVQALADYFHINKSDLIEDKSAEPQTTAPHTPKIMTYYDQLNDLGKREATKRVEELTYFPQYSTNQVNAAHADDYANAPEELKQLEEEIIDKAFRLD